MLGSTVAVGTLFIGKVSHYKRKINSQINSMKTACPMQVALRGKTVFYCSWLKIATTGLAKTSIVIFAPEAVTSRS